MKTKELGAQKPGGMPKWSSAVSDLCRTMFPGLVLAATLALASHFIAARYGGPIMLYALLFGFAFNFLGEEKKCAAGLQAASRQVLQLGVALLGAAITFRQAASLGVATLTLVAIGIVGALAGGYFIGRKFRLSPDHAFLSAGAVAICGASAAMAIAAALPKRNDSERNMTLTVLGVTAFSTAAMLIYPALVPLMNLSNASAGILLGATIHDVAQVVGAGHMVSDETGAVSAVVKLVRVASLPAVVLFASVAFRTDPDARRASQPALPVFVIGFLLIMTAHSFQALPEAIFKALAAFSKSAFVMAIAAFGVRTPLKEFMQVGARPFLVVGLQTLLLLLIIVTGIFLAPDRVAMIHLDW